MKTIRLMANSSSGDAPYEVVFQNSGTVFTANCSCQGAINGSLCKHLKGLLEGDATLLFEGYGWDELEEVLDWVAKSEYPSLQKEHETAVKLAEKSKEEEKRLKKRLGRMVQEGVKLTKTQKS